MLKNIFMCVANALLKIANVTHFTYNEINIIIYYFIIPLTWCMMLDIIIHSPVFTVTWILLIFTICLFVDNFSDWCDKVFKLSQKFICFFGEYVKYSVVICVLVPIVIYAILGMVITSVS